MGQLRPGRASTGPAMSAMRLKRKQLRSTSNSATNHCLPHRELSVAGWSQRVGRTRAIWDRTMEAAVSAIPQQRAAVNF